jgi:hypothetical protein
MESCRSVFLAKLYSVMTRPLRCVVASGPGQRPTGSGCALRFPDLGSRRQVIAGVTFAISQEVL